MNMTLFKNLNLDLPSFAAAFADQELDVLDKWRVYGTWDFFDAEFDSDSR